MHLGNALEQEGCIKNLGFLKETARNLRDKSFFTGGERPKKGADYLKKFGLAIGVSATNFASDASRAGRDQSTVAARKGKHEVIRPAAFSRKVCEHLRDPFRRFTLTEADLIDMLSECSIPLRNLYAAAQAGKRGTNPARSPLQRATELLNAEALVLEHDYFGSLRVAWEALSAVDAVVPGPKALQLSAGSGGRGGRGGSGGQGRGSKGNGTALAEKEEAQRVQDAAITIANRALHYAENGVIMRAVGKAFWDAVSE